MADFIKDLRLAVDTGSVVLGTEETKRAVSGNKAKIVIISSKGKPGVNSDMIHLCNVAGVKVMTFEGSSIELGAVCGKPFSVNSLAVIEEGESKILNENY